MCDPVTATLIAATAVAAVGTGVSAISANNQAKYQGKVADMNARMDNAAARDAIDRGKVESQRFQREASQMQGAQRASLAANGIDVNFGSAAAVRADTTRAIEEDAQTIRENSMREVRGFEINAANFGAQARGYRAAGKAALVKGAFDMGSTVLGGAQQYSKLKAGRA